jgi:hypothetical protein
MWCRAVGLIMTLTLSLVAALLAANAQSVAKTPRFGILNPAFSGGLMSYGANDNDIHRRQARRSSCRAVDEVRGLDQP